MFQNNLNALERTIFDAPKLGEKVNQVVLDILKNTNLKLINEEERRFGEGGTYDKSNAFLTAVRFCNKEVIKKLLDIDIHYLELKTKLGNDALCVAARNGNFEVTKYLIENHHMDVTFKGRYGSIPFTQASLDKKTTPEFLDYLLNKTIEHYKKYPTKITKKFSHEELSKHIVNLSSIFGSASLHYCTIGEHDHVAPVRYLVEKGADLYSINAFGRIPLFCAINDKHYEIFCYLFEQYSKNLFKKDNFYEYIKDAYFYAKIRNFYKAESYIDSFIKKYQKMYPILKTIYQIVPKKLVRYKSVKKYENRKLQAEAWLLKYTEFTELTDQKIKKFDLIKLLQSAKDLIDNFLLNTGPLLYHLKWDFSLANHGKFVFYTKLRKYDVSYRESECAYYLCQGKSAKEIGRILDISYRTIEKHINQLRNKLNCSTQAKLIVRLLREKS